MMSNVTVGHLVREIGFMWQCPKCLRTFCGHVFANSTPAEGPVCNACCAPLQWIEVEVEVQMDEPPSR